MPGSEAALAGIRVLITRPESQADKLDALVREAGGQPLRFPTLTIVPLQPDPGEVAALEDCDMAIFVSPNAALHGYPLLRNVGTAGKKVVAVGRSTRRALTRLGSEAIQDPGEQGSSEALLAQAVLRDVSGRRVCIVRGRGGRELLRETLTDRGARVSYLECYSRERPPRSDPAVLKQMLQAGPGASVVTATSTTGLANLLAMTPEADRGRLAALPLVVIGARQAAAARAEDWRGPVMAAPPGDDGIVETVVAWRHNGHPDPRG